MRFFRGNHKQSMTSSQLETANIAWQNNQPYSHQFNDVYFSSENGMLETEYVFLAGNQLHNRWQDVNLTHFTIIETGFGTGLNFLCAAQLWLTTAPIEAKLHFISIEKYPLSSQNLKQALALWPALSIVSKPLIDAYQQINLSSFPQVVTIKLRQNIELSFLIDDVTGCLHKIHHQADAWFLDGFAPSKNPDMWQKSLFNQMARLSHANTTFATFTSAGIVRRGLIEAGFIVKKQSGFGKKREMLLGQFNLT
jgi:tRNA 5-methylaminomethyl-2-thiouridine biosynthesis bifunctional protein